jgi:hypothetical protein
MFLFSEALFMLSDTPRKLLLVINHYSRHFGRMPSLPELERLSGRMPVDIRNGLKEVDGGKLHRMEPEYTARDGLYYLWLGKR